MIDLHRLAAEHRVGEGMALADGDGGEVDAVGDVSHRINGGHGALREGIDLDGHVGRHLDAEAVQPQPCDIGDAAGGEHHLPCPEGRAVVQRDAHAIAGAVDPRHVGAGADLDALLLHLGGEVVADVVIEAAQDLLAAVDEHGLHPEAGEDAGEFDRDVAAADDDDARRAASPGGRPRWR